MEISNGEIYKGNFLDGKVHGKGEFYDIYGKNTKGFYKENIVTIYIYLYIKLNIYKIK